MSRQTLKRIVLGLVLTALTLAGLSQCGWVQQIKLDREVDRLCAIDGGVHIYETVFLPKESFGPDGEAFPQYRQLLFTESRYGPEFFGRIADKVLVSGSPALQRLNSLIVRRSDDKVLGEMVIYRRSGGDGPWLSASSRHSCPEGPEFNLEGQVFKPQQN